MDEPQLHFVVSAPRSGSTWLTTALNHHGELFGTEQRLFGNFCEVWQNNDGSTAPRITLDKYASAFGMHYFYQFMNRDYDGFVEDFKTSFIRFMMHFAMNRTGKKVIIDKITPYPGTAAMVVGEIRRLFPESKIVLLIRDGRDVVTSGTFDWLLKDAAGTDRYRFFCDREPGMQLTRFFDDQVIERWANNWAETVNAFRECPADVRVTYEQLKTDFDSAIGSVFQGLGVEDSASIRQQCREATTFDAMAGRSAGDNASPTAKARKGITGDWKNFFTQADAKLFSNIAGKQLIETGYEVNDDWVQCLPEQLVYCL